MTTGRGRGVRPRCGWNPECLGEHGPQRFRTEDGGKGHGPGPTIAAGQSAVIGAEPRFSNAEDGGAVARLTLPEHVRFTDDGPLDSRTEDAL